MTWSVFLGPRRLPRYSSLHLLRRGPLQPPPSSANNCGTCRPDSGTRDRCGRELRARRQEAPSAMFHNQINRSLEKDDLELGSYTPGVPPSGKRFALRKNWTSLVPRNLASSQCAQVEPRASFAVLEYMPKRVRIRDARGALHQGCDGWHAGRPSGTACSRSRRRGRRPRRAPPDARVATQDSASPPPWTPSTVLAKQFETGVRASVRSVFTCILRI